jgi:hypothetical protein
MKAARLKARRAALMQVAYFGDSGLSSVCWLTNIKSSNKADDFLIQFLYITAVEPFSTPD